MMLRNMQKTIVKAIPSSELRREIELWGYRFSELDLIKIAYRCAPSFGRLQNLWGLVTREASEPVAEYAKKLMRWQFAVRDEFCRADEDAVYELTIKTTPDAEARFVCETTAEVRAKQREYLAGVDEPEKAYSAVIKRSIISGDWLGRAELLPNGLFRSVEAYAVPCPADGELDLIYGDDTSFPIHIADRGLVRYTSEGIEHLGVHRMWTCGLVEALFVIPLDGNMMRLHDYEGTDDQHEHVYPPFAFSAEISELDDRQRADYSAYLDYLDNK